jgi:hypothetical protein
MPVIVAGYTRQAEATALAASGVISTFRTRLYYVFGFNNGGDQFLHLFNATAVPADAAVPQVPFRIYGGGNFEFSLGDYGWYFPAGLCWSNSSTLATKTIGAANLWVNAVYHNP